MTATFLGSSSICSSSPVAPSSRVSVQGIVLPCSHEFVHSVVVCIIFLRLSCALLCTVFSLSLKWVKYLPLLVTFPTIHFFPLYFTLSPFLKFLGGGAIYTTLGIWRWCWCWRQFGSCCHLLAVTNFFASSLCAAECQLSGWRFTASLIGW